MNFLESEPPIIKPRAPEIIGVKADAKPPEDPTMMTAIVAVITEVLTVTKSLKNDFFNTTVILPKPVGSI